MKARVSLITLGVADIKRARAFYEALGFQASSDSQDSVVFFRAGGVVLGLYGRAALAEDCGIADSGKPGFAGITLAHNCRNEAEVDRVLGEAVANGGALIKSARHVFWGGYSGYFADPDGHLWEVAHNPHWGFNEDGSIALP